MPLNLAAKPTVPSIGMPSAPRYSPIRDAVSDPSIVEGRRLDNELKRRKLAAYDPEYAKALEAISVQANAAGAFLKAKSAGINDDQAYRLYQSMGGNENVKLETTGENVEFSILGQNGEGFKISGRTEDVKKIGNHLDAIAANPEAGLSAQMSRVLREQGISWERVKPEKEELTPQEKSDMIEKRQKRVADYKKGLKGGKGNKTEEYKKDAAKLVDDTRGYYSLKMKTLLDEDGYIKEGKEEDYKKLSDQMDNDLAKVGRGEQPSWLGPELPEDLSSDMFKKLKEKYSNKSDEDIIKAWQNRQK